MVKWDNFNPFFKIVYGYQNKTCPVEDGGLLGPMKSNPYFEKGKSGRTGCNGLAKKHSFPTIFWHLSQDLEKT